MDEAQQAVLGDLAAQMFAGPIATGEIVVDDPPEADIPVAQVPPPAAAPVAVPAQVAPPETQPAAEAVTPESVPTFKPKLSEDLQALLDEPDFEEEARAEVQAELDDPEGEYEYTDPEVAAANRAKDKRIAFLEGQLVAKSKKGWVEEAKRAFPDLARLMPGEIEGISASSRRAFIRAADTLNTHYSTALAPTLARLEAERAAIANSAVSVARKEVQNAWGVPAGDTLPSLTAATQDALEATRKASDLDAGIKVLMQEHPVL